MYSFIKTVFGNIYFFMRFYTEMPFLWKRIFINSDIRTTKVGTSSLNLVIWESTQQTEDMKSWGK